ncbi:MAG: [Fe-Fe] hydrogenase large subunit C-terminal domain-containing protein [Candidatus Diapherotrites archaeon]
MADIEKVMEILDAEKLHVVAQVAPALRVTIGEEFGYKPGTVLTKKLVGALKKAGFDKVFDTSTAADVVTVEEGTEFLKRLRTGECLPLFTSCCPASILYVENHFPRYVDHFCTVKSPQQTMGSLIKTYYAREMKMKQKDIFSVSIMPCVVKKLEAKRPEMEFDGIRHVDAVLTTRDIAKLLKEKKINLKDVKEAEFDNLLGDASGAGQLFGTTGGVAEALLRFVSWKLEGKDKRIDFKEVRGKEGFREANVKIAGQKFKIAIVHGLHNLKDLISNEKRFEKYHVIEMMVCPFGCVGGGGQPISTPEIREARREALIGIDSKEHARFCMENPELKKLYDDYLGEPGSRTASSLLHTHRICLKCGVSLQEKIKKDLE